MKHLLVWVITPKKIVKKEEAIAVTAPAVGGEITILFNHLPLFTLLEEGIVKIKKPEEEIHLAIGGGYLQTDGKKVNILVSRAYGQEEIDEKAIFQAKKDAERLLKESKSEEERKKAMALLRRSLIDLKLLRFRKKKSSLSS